MSIKLETGRKFNWRDVLKKKISEEKLSLNVGISTLKQELLLMKKVARLNSCG